MQNLYCKSILFVTFCLLLTISFSAWAQTTVKGTVTDAATNEGLPGVAVLVKPGNTGGTITDFDGNYEIRVPSDASLQFSYVGYRTQVIAVNNQTAINVQLVEDVAKLDEVVVTGLATNVKRSNLANAVATLSAKELTGVTPPQTLQNGLSGKIPGANLVANSGAPGGGISMKLRGVTTVLGSSQPLFVVDGVIMDNSSTSGGLNAVTAAAAGGNASTQDNASNRIADLNPDDIESIEVLKGASAAAIYGSLAASGVVIISTKRGSAGRTNINLSQDIGVAMANKLLGVRDLSGLDTAQAISLLEQAIADPAAVQLLLPVYLKSKNDTMATALINGLPTTTTAEINYKALAQLLLNKNINNQAWWQLNETEIEWAKNLAETNTKTGFATQALLALSIGREYYLPPVNMPDTSFSGKRQPPPPHAPNPAVYFENTIAQHNWQFSHNLNNNQQAEVMVYDALGHLVSRQTVKGTGKTTINAHHLPPAIYFAVVKTANEPAIREKLLIVR